MDVSSEPLRVLVIDDDPLVRTGIRLMLRGNVNVSIVGEMAGHRGLFEAIAEHRPGALLMDVVMPDESGLSVARRVRMMYPNLRIVLMSSIDKAGLSADARNVGVNTFVAKTAPASDFIAALVGLTSPTRVSATVLSDREIQVVELLAMGSSNDDISSTLHLSQNTVKTYVSRAMDKTGTTNRVQLSNWFRSVSDGRLLSAPAPSD